jgi:xanthine dehydrogenase accessory factor
MVPETMRGLAPLTIGLGPNFEVGANADIVVETAWGDELGRVISKGRAKDLSGEPREIGGHARDRYIYAPAEGTFESTYGIGNTVSAGENVARIGEIAIHAPLAGVVRGIVRDGVLVGAGEKVLEIDPRARSEAVFGIGERPAKIAVGVLKAIAQIGTAHMAG